MEMSEKDKSNVIKVVILSEEKGERDMATLAQNLASAFSRDEVSFEMNETEREIMQMVRDFAYNELKPRAAQIDETGQLPMDLVKKMSDLGLMGISLPEEYGGAGQSYVLFARIIEELCAACASTGLVPDVNISLGAEPILMFGNEE